jgi:hypothetical protein
VSGELPDGLAAVLLTSAIHPRRREGGAMRRAFHGALAESLFSREPPLPGDQDERLPRETEMKVEMEDRDV